MLADFILCNNDHENLTDQVLFSEWLKIPIVSQFLNYLTNSSAINAPVICIHDHPPTGIAVE